MSFSSYADVAAALAAESAAYNPNETQPGWNAAHAHANAARAWWNNYLANQGGSAPPSPSPPPPPPSPILPSFTRHVSTDQILVAPRDTVLFDSDELSVQYMQQLLFEEIGGVELANMSRSDLIDGQDVTYSAIANLSEIYRMYNPNNIVSSTSSSQYFSEFGIDLLSRGIYVPELDSDGNLVIKIDNINAGEVIEYQISLSGTIDRVDE